MRGKYRVVTLKSGRQDLKIGLRISAPINLLSKFTKATLFFPDEYQLGEKFGCRWLDYKGLGKCSSSVDKLAGFSVKNVWAPTLWIA